MAQAVNPYDAPKAAVADAGATQPVRVFSISGRIGRARYIAYGMGFYLLVSVIGALLMAALGAENLVVLVAMWSALIVISFMLTIQRCHDFNTSGWLSLLVLIPLANLVFWFIPGTDGPNRYGPPTSKNSVGVIIAVCVVPFLFVGGILAAIAIPAYQDYTLRARASEAIVSALEWRAAVGAYYGRNGTFPASTADLGNDAPAAASGKYGSVRLGRNGVLTITMSGETGALANKTIELRPQATAGALNWDCTGGTLERKYRPASCR
jgi:uncharacterized membrane protein YhaH (DUF805 family)/Tfp pilus assembly protein PilE